jgi:hypothetical protein
MSPGWARLTVRREVFNGGQEIDEAIYALQHPEDSVAVGLRTKASGPGSTWFQGQLLAVEVAAARYLELTGQGQAIPRDPALLYWVSPSQLGLQVFPCAIGKSQWVEYTLLMPTLYEEGRDRLQLPRFGLEGKPAAFTVKSEKGGGRIQVQGIGVSVGGEATVAGTEEFTTVEFVTASPAPLSARFASVGLASARSYDWVQLRAAPKISTVPENAWLVIVADTSVSMGDGAMTDYSAGVSAWLSHFQGAHVALVAFDRVARDVSKGWVTPRAAIESMQQWPKKSRNGSHVDLALERARQLLAMAPAGAAKRVVVLTDARTRRALTQARVDKALLDTKAVVHVANLSSGNATLEEDSDHAWRAGTQATGGLTWHASAGSNDTENRSVFEEWARPRHYTLTSVKAGELPFGDLEKPYQLDEGRSWHAAILRPGRAGRLSVTARLWGRQIHLDVTSQPEEAKRLSALATAQQADELDFTEEELRELAWKGGAVSPFTSYLAVEPGVRPSTAGIDRRGGDVGSGQGFGSGHGRLGGSHKVTPTPFDHHAWLVEAVKQVRRDCQAEGIALTAVVETHRDELIDLPQLDLAPADTTKRGCLLDGLWGLSLPGEFWRVDSEQYTVIL